MKTRTLGTVGTLLAATPAWAAGGGEGWGLWTLLFVGFAAVVVAAQAAPAAVLFAGMLRGLFRPGRAAETERV